MNRSILLFLFICMFFSCGNSTDALGDSSLIKSPDLMVSENALSPEHKFMAKRIDSMFRKFYQTKQFNGTVLVAKAGKIIYKNNFGIENKKTMLR